MKREQAHYCSNCAMNQICLPLGVDKKDIEQLESLVQTSNTLVPNQVVFDQSEPFKRVYAVKSGTLKSTRIDENGNEYVLGFHLPGELVGLDGIYPNNYTSKTIALDSVVLCAMEYDKLTELCSSVPALQRQLLRLLSRDIYESHVASAEKSDQTALQKLAGFINNLSVRHEQRGYSRNSLKLAMTRQDIANHLGLTPETVSRLLKRLKDEGTISIENRNIQINSHSYIKKLIGCDLVKAI